MTECRRALLVVALGMLAGAAQAAPSFDCRRASASAEKTICATPALAALDVEVARLYALTRRGAAQRAPRLRELQRSQRDWQRDRNECWKGTQPTQCLTVSHLSRIAELRTAYGETRRDDGKGKSLGPVALRCNGWSGLAAATFVNTEPRRVYLQWPGGAWYGQAMPSGSGARYEGRAADGELHFWTQGDRATLQRPGEAAASDCRVERIG